MRIDKFITESSLNPAWLVDWLWKRGMTKWEVLSRQLLPVPNSWQGMRLGQELLTDHPSHPNQSRIAHCDAAMQLLLDVSLPHLFGGE